MTDSKVEFLYLNEEDILENFLDFNNMPDAVWILWQKLSVC